MADNDRLDRFRTGTGFIAALDQSGGSTPKALALYGIDDSHYSSEAEMFDLIHRARTRVITDPAFTGDRILGAILFQDTLDRDIDGTSTATYLHGKNILPILKIDKGLENQSDGVSLMREIPGLAATLAAAADQGVFGTKERSVIGSAHAEGIGRIVDQQFDIAEQVLAAGLLPILEPEVLITATDKADAEKYLKDALLTRLDGFDADVAIKVTLPSTDDFYAELIDHPRVARVVALSGGYQRDEANARLARNPGLIASFSRALLDGLTAGQSDEEFSATLDASIAGIYAASTT